jgi:predicted phage baseplate assembly protein
MPLTPPNLDDRQYADIVAEAKTLISRYAPEWTNYNESDPGITLVELFAWMTEILVYRLNQVPDLNYIKFLRLLGIELQAAQPASAAITFKVSNPNLTSVIVPQGTQIAASGTGSQPIIFETDESLIVIGAVLGAVQTYDGTAYTVQTAKNANPGQWFYPFGQTPQVGCALLLGFSSPVAFPAVQINLTVNLFQNGLIRPIFQCGAGIPPPATLAWEYWNGSQWVTLNVASDGTRAFSQDGHILFNGPTGNVPGAQIGSVTGTYYWFRARIMTATYEMPPQVASIMTNTINATQAITFTNEILGGSNGTPNQTFQVTNTPVVALPSLLTVTNSGGMTVTVTDVRLEIDEGQGFIVWQEVDDFYSSGPNDAVFTLDRDSGVVTMGSGDHGRIPVINQNNPTGNVVARTYRAGGGSQGNVGVNTITQILTTVQSINGATNNQPATGGTDEETVADAQLRAPLALQSQGRAVTDDDFVSLAMQAPGANVKRALALPLVHPDFPNGEIPGVVTVVVVPNSPAPAPTPNQTTLQAVGAYLDAHRLLTCEVYVVGPVYRKVKVEVELIVDNGSDLGTVQNAALAALNTFFSPLLGGDDKTGWPFGGEIYYSDVYRVILDTPGVERIQDNQLLILLDDQMQQFCRDVAINPGELLYNDPLGHQVSVSYDTSS